MPKRVAPYRDWIGGKLSDPRAAAAYLNAARKDSAEAFFKALRRVAESHKMTKVAEEAGVSRESVYRMTMPGSNPTHTSFEGILRAVGLDFLIVPMGEIQITTTPLPAGQSIKSDPDFSPTEHNHIRAGANFHAGFSSTSFFNPYPFRSFGSKTANALIFHGATEAANDNIGHIAISPHQAGSEAVLHGR